MARRRSKPRGRSADRGPTESHRAEVPPDRTGIDPSALCQVAILVLGLALRAYDLGRMPLQTDEAANALQSWSVHLGLGGDAAAGPLLIYGNSLVFFLFGASDATARLIPALFGTALVAMPYFLREEIGNRGAVLASLLLAISPSLVFFSRQSESYILAATTSLGLVVAVAAYTRTSRPRAAHWMALFAALLLTSGPWAYTSISAFGVLAALRALTRWAEVRQGTVPLLALPQPWPRFDTLAGDASAVRTTLKQSLLVGIAVFLVVSMGGVTSLGGLRDGMIRPLASWTLDIAVGVLNPALMYLPRLLIYEPAALIFCVVGAAYYLRRGRHDISDRHAFQRFLAWWAVLALLLASLSAHRPPGLLPQIIVPTAVLAGSFAGELIEELRRYQFRIQLAWYSLALMILLGGARVGLNHFSLPDPFVPEWLIVAPLLALALVAISPAIVAERLGEARAFRLGGVFALGLLLVLTWRTTTMLSYGPEANPAEPLVRWATSSDIRSLATDLREVEYVLAMNRRDRTIAVDTTLGEPVRWYLRDLPDIHYGKNLAGEWAVIVASADSGLALADYRGQRYRVSATKRVKFYGWQDIWRWLAYREMRTAASVADALLLVRSH